MSNNLTFKKTFRWYRPCSETTAAKINNSDKEHVIIDEPEEEEELYCDDKVYKTVRSDHYITGPIVDRLHEFEKLGYEPGQLKQIIHLYRMYRLAAHSTYGTMGTYRDTDSLSSRKNDTADLKKMFNVIDSVNEELVKKIMEQPVITRPINYQKIYVTTSSSFKGDEFFKKVKEAMENMKEYDNHLEKVKNVIYEEFGVPKSILESSDAKKQLEAYRYIHEDTDSTYRLVWRHGSRAIGKVNNVEHDKDGIKMNVIFKNTYDATKPSTIIKKSGDRPWGWGVPGIKSVIFNNPATIVFWSDGDKTVVKAQNGEPYDPEKGLAMAISKKAMGNDNKWYNEFKKQLKEQPTEAPKNNDAVVATAEKAYLELSYILDDKKATKADMIDAMEKSMGFLGEVLYN